MKLSFLIELSTFRMRQPCFTIFVFEWNVILHYNIYHLVIKQILKRISENWYVHCKCSLGLVAWLARLVQSRSGMVHR